MPLKIAAVVLAASLAVSVVVGWKVRKIHSRAESVKAVAKMVKQKNAALAGEIRHLKGLPDAPLRLLPPLQALATTEGLVSLVGPVGKVRLEIFPGQRLGDASVQEKVAGFPGLGSVGYIPFSLSFAGVPYPLVRKVWLGLARVPAVVEGMTYRRGRLELTGKIYVRKTG